MKICAASDVSSDEHLDNKGGVFVMYNFARLSTLFLHFEEAVAKGQLDCNCVRDYNYFFSQFHLDFTDLLVSRCRIMSVDYNRSDFDELKLSRLQLDF